MRARSSALAAALPLAASSGPKFLQGTGNTSATWSRSAPDAVFPAALPRLLPCTPWFAICQSGLSVCSFPACSSIREDHDTCMGTRSNGCAAVS